MKVELGTTHNITSSFTGKAAAGYMSASFAIWKIFGFWRN